MHRAFLAVFAILMLAGCASESVWAPDEEVARAAYRHDGSPELTLFTMINNRSGAGGHTSLMVSGSQRVIFDPAGSFKHPAIPERNDVVFGITPAVEDIYTRYHARESWHVRVQRITVSPEVAARALAMVQSYGAVPSAQCARSTSSIMAQLFPGQITETWYPKRLAEEFATVAGVTERRLHEYDSDDNTKVLKDWDPNLVARALTYE